MLYLYDKHISNCKLGCLKFFCDRLWPWEKVERGLRGEERAGENYLFLDANKVEYLIVDMVASCQMYSSTKPCHVRLKPTSDNRQASCDIFGLVLLVGYSTVVEARAQGRDVGGCKHNYLFT